MRLIIQRAMHDVVIQHLLPVTKEPEQAAFLFGRYAAGESSVSVISYRLLSGADFLSQEDDFLELTDFARASLIKEAHDLHACLVEVHSHVGPWPAMFSAADCSGLVETAPHMLWRLPGRPYLAIVVTRTGFDALVWKPGSSGPVALNSIDLSGKILRPTNLSIESWQ